MHSIGSTCMHHQVRLATPSVNASSASLASLAGSTARTSLAFSAYARARPRVREMPDDAWINESAYPVGRLARRKERKNVLTRSTSPSCLNPRAIRGSNSGYSSAAYSTGPVAIPRRRSTPEPGLPSATEDEKSRMSSTSWETR